MIKLGSEPQYFFADVNIVSEILAENGISTEHPQHEFYKKYILDQMKGTFFTSPEEREQSILNYIPKVTSLSFRKGILKFGTITDVEADEPGFPEPEVTKQELKRLYVQEAKDIYDEEAMDFIISDFVRVLEEIIEWHKSEWYLQHYELDLPGKIVENNIKKLLQILQQAKTSQEKMIAIDQVINTEHQTGIYGGHLIKGVDREGDPFYDELSNLKISSLNMRKKAEPETPQENFYEPGKSDEYPKGPKKPKRRFPFYNYPPDDQGNMINVDPNYSNPMEYDTTPGPHPQGPGIFGNLNMRKKAQEEEEEENPFFAVKPQVTKQELRNLYKQEAKGIYDEELMDEVISKFIETLEKMYEAFAKFGLENQEFYDLIIILQRAKTPQEKMIAIDQVITYVHRTGMYVEYLVVDGDEAFLDELSNLKISSLNMRKKGKGLKEYIRENIEEQFIIPQQLKLRFGKVAQVEFNVGDEITFDTTRYLGRGKKRVGGPLRGKGVITKKEDDTYSIKIIELTEVVEDLKNIFRIGLTAEFALDEIKLEKPKIEPKEEIPVEKPELELEEEPPKLLFELEEEEEEKIPTPEEVEKEEEKEKIPFWKELVQETWKGFKKPIKPFGSKLRMKKTADIEDHEYVWKEIHQGKIPTYIFKGFQEGLHGEKYITVNCDICQSTLTLTAKETKANEYKIEGLPRGWEKEVEANRLRMKKKAVVSADELKRVYTLELLYRELEQKYNAGTLTEDESVQFTQTEKELDSLTDKVVRDLMFFFEDYLRWYKKDPKRIREAEEPLFGGEQEVVDNMKIRLDELTNAFDINTQMIAIDNVINMMHVDFPIISHLAWEHEEHIEEMRESGTGVECDWEGLIEFLQDQGKLQEDVAFTFGSTRVDQVKLSAKKYKGPIISILEDIAQDVWTATDLEEAKSIIINRVEGSQIDEDDKQTIIDTTNKIDNLLELQKYIANSILFYEGMGTKLSMRKKAQEVDPFFESHYYVTKQELRNLYKQEAKGIYDEELMDEVISGFLVTLGEMLSVAKKDKWRSKIEEIEWLINILGKPTTPQEKMIAIDQVINFVHTVGEYIDYLVEDGSMSFLDELSRLKISSLNIGKKAKVSVEGTPTEEGGSWAIYQGTIYITHESKLHTKWFEELGLPTVGPEYDNIVRGYFKEGYIVWYGVGDFNEFSDHLEELRIEIGYPEDAQIKMLDYTTQEFEVLAMRKKLSQKEPTIIEPEITKQELRNLYIQEAKGIYDEEAMDSIISGFLVVVESLIAHEEWIIKYRLRYVDEDDYDFIRELENLIRPLQQAKTSQEKMIAIDQVINTFHHTGKEGQYLIKGVEPGDLSFFNELSNLKVSSLNMRKQSVVPVPLRMSLDYPHSWPQKNKKKKEDEEKKALKIAQDISDPNKLSVQEIKRFYELEPKSSLTDEIVDNVLSKLIYGMQKEMERVSEDPEIGNYAKRDFMATMGYNIGELEKVATKSLNEKIIAIDYVIHYLHLSKGFGVFQGDRDEIWDIIESIGGKREISLRFDLNMRKEADLKSSILSLLLVGTTIPGIADMIGVPQKQVEQTIQSYPKYFEEVEQPELTLLPEYVVTATVYNATPEQTSADPEFTADMTRIDPDNVPTAEGERIIALSRDLLKKFTPDAPFDYGDKILVEGAGEMDGVWVVHDTMHIRFLNYIDFLVPKGITTGKWENVKINKVHQVEAVLNMRKKAQEGIDEYEERGEYELREEVISKLPLVSQKKLVKLYKQEALGIYDEELMDEIILDFLECLAYLAKSFISPIKEIAENLNKVLTASPQEKMIMIDTTIQIIHGGGLMGEFLIESFSKDFLDNLHELSDPNKLKISMRKKATNVSVPTPSDSLHEQQGEQNLLHVYFQGKDRWISREPDQGFDIDFPSKERIKRSPWPFDDTTPTSQMMASLSMRKTAQIDEQMFFDFYGLSLLSDQYLEANPYAKEYKDMIINQIKEAYVLLITKMVYSELKKHTFELEDWADWLEEFKPKNIKALTLDQLKQIYNEGDWMEEFGGPAWGSIVESLIQLKNTTDTNQLITIIDHINDIEHNTGLMFHDFPKIKEWFSDALDIKAEATPEGLIPYLSTDLQKLVTEDLKLKGQEVVAPERYVTVEERIDIAQDPNTPPETLAELAKDEDIRWAVAVNPSTPPKTLAELAKDENSDVRWNVANNPNTPPEVKKKLQSLFASLSMRKTAQVSLETLKQFYTDMETEQYNEKRLQYILDEWSNVLDKLTKPANISNEEFEEFKERILSHLTIKEDWPVGEKDPYRLAMKIDGIIDFLHEGYPEFRYQFVSGNKEDIGMWFDLSQESRGKEASILSMRKQAKVIVEDFPFPEGIWAIYKGNIYITGANKIHEQWFEELGLPFVGEEFDNVVRGHFYDYAFGRKMIKPEEKKIIWYRTGDFNEFYDYLDELKSALGFPSDAEIEMLDYTNQEKKSSILDYPQKHLDPIMWDLSGDLPKLKENIKGLIVERFLNYLREEGKLNSPELWCTGFYYTGSTATYRYRSTSDIDIHVKVDWEKFKKSNPDKAKDDVEEMHKDLLQVFWNTLNKEVLPDTQHPLTYYVLSERENVFEQGEEAYDILNDSWIVSPHKIPENLDIDEKIELLGVQANAIMEKLDEELGKTKRDFIDYKILKELLDSYEGDKKDIQKLIEKKLEDVEQGLKGLQEENVKIHEERQKAFYDGQEPIEEGLSQNWAPGNIIFKLVEKYRYVDVLRKIKHIIEDDKITEEEEKQLEDILEPKLSMRKKMMQENDLPFPDPQTTKQELKRLYIQEVKGIYDEELMDEIISKFIQDLLAMADWREKHQKDLLNKDWVEVAHGLIVILEQAKTPQEKMIAIDQIINEVHFTGSFGEFLIKSGNEEFFEQLGNLKVSKLNMRKKAISDMEIPENWMVKDKTDKKLRRTNPPRHDKNDSLVEHNIDPRIDMASLSMRKKAQEEPLIPKPQVTKQEIKRLYIQNAKGIYDEELMDEIISEFIRVLEVVVKKLEWLYDKYETDVERFKEQAEEVKELVGILQRAGTPQEKMIAIDQVISTIHKSGLYADYLIVDIDPGFSSWDFFFSELGNLRISSLNMRKKAQDREAWQVVWAEGRAVQYFENEKDADIFIDSGKNEEFGFVNKKYVEKVPKGYTIHKGPTYYKESFYGQPTDKNYNSPSLLLREDQGPSYPSGPNQAEIPGTADDDSWGESNKLKKKRPTKELIFPDFQTTYKSPGGEVGQY